MNKRIHHYLLLVPLCINLGILIPAHVFVLLLAAITFPGMNIDSMINRTIVCVVLGVLQFVLYIALGNHTEEPTE